MAVNQSRTMFGAPLCVSPDEVSADVAFLGLPWGTPGLFTGWSATGPQAVRDALVYYYAGREGGRPAQGYYDYDTDTEYLQGVTMVDCGDIPMTSRDVATNFERVEATVRRILDRGAFLVGVGGEHSIVSAVVKAYDRYEPLDVVHFDAHHDFYELTEGAPYSGGTVRRISGLPFVRNVATIGLRPYASPHTGRAAYEDMKKRGVTIITAKRFQELGPEAAISLVPEAQTLYITLDMDVFDMAWGGGSRTPAVGGLTYLEVKSALRELTKKGKVVGMDVVEVSPIREPSVTPIVAGQLIIDMLSLLFPSRG